MAAKEYKERFKNHKKLFRDVTYFKETGKADDPLGQAGQS